MTENDQFDKKSLLCFADQKLKWKELANGSDAGPQGIGLPADSLDKFS